MDEDTLRRLATQLLEELGDEIPDTAERQPVHDSLTDALASPSGTASPALIAALRSTSITRDWVRRHTSLEDTDRLAGLHGSGPGGSPLTGGRVFACRKCGYSKTRESASSTVLFCPRDGSILARLR